MLYIKTFIYMLQFKFIYVCMCGVGIYIQTEDSRLSNIHSVLKNQNFQIIERTLSDGK